MASIYWNGTFSVRPHTLRLTLNEGTKNIANNTTVINWSLEVYRAPNFKPWGSDGTWSVNINGVPYSGTFSYNFNNYTYLLLATGSTTVTHNADGTKTISASSSAYLGTAGGSASAGGNFTLTTIPRATTPTVSPASGTTGTTFTINHEPATSSFYHDVAYSLDGGANYTNIQTNIVGTDTSTSWTPAHSLLPNDTSATAIIRLITRASSGGTIIGTKTVNLPLTVPTSVKPTVASVAWADAQTSSPNLPSLMGGSDRFVQRWSRLIPTVTATGAGGSTVTSTEVTQGGQATSSGVAFALPVSTSGSVPFTATATDSRSRVSDALVGTVAVKAYNFPSLPTPLVVRTSDAAGSVPAPTGTYLAITPAASVSSLNFGDGEKNLLEYRVRIRPAGGAFTTVQDWTSTGVSGTTWTSKRVFAGYAASQEWEVEVSVRDVFGKNGFDTANTVKSLSVLVPTEFVFMDWDGPNGVGIGGYRRMDYRLDVHGKLNADEAHADAIYQDGNAVIDSTDLATTSAPGIVELATNAETLAGTDSSSAVTPASFKSALNDPSNGYRLRQVVTFTSSGTFTKASYPWLRAIRVCVVGGGGAGGGSASTPSGQNSEGGGGGGGGYAESFITDISGLSSSIPVTVGAGGVGASGSSGGAGGTSSFGTLVEATGGGGGGSKPSSAVAGYGVSGGSGGEGIVGDILGAGSGGTAGQGSATIGASGAGGASALGGGGLGQASGATGGGGTGAAGKGYGGGGGGALSNQSSSARAGGAGSDGVVIVELYA